MAAQTGRTHSRWIDFRVDDSAGTLRSIPVNSINGIGLTHEEMDVTAFQDAIKNSVLGHPDAPIEISGPFDNSAAAAAGTLSGSHTILSAIAGLTVPLTLDIQVGIGHAWEAGEPQFGITSSAINGYLCSSYVVDMNSMTYSAKFVISQRSIAPAWGVAAET